MSEFDAGIAERTDISSIEAGQHEADDPTADGTMRAALIGLPDAVFDAAFRLAHLITQDDDVACEAVVAGCSLVLAGGSERRSSLRLELLDAVLRCADRLAPGLDPADYLVAPLAWTNVCAAADRHTRDSLALALAAHCSTTDIAEILGLSRSDVCRHLRDALCRPPA